jgi:predicted Ser/Thr protein kinase
LDVPPIDEPEVEGEVSLELRHLRQQLKHKMFGRTDEPTRLGRFVILERLGEGGMGVVFSCFDPTLDRKVAIKVLRGQAGERGDRQRRGTLREAQALARLSHPNVIGVFEVGELDDYVFIVMEFIRGMTLKRWLAGEPRPIAEVLAVACKAGEGLVAAHRAGLVHRDFKPENVMLGEDGSVRVLDFGLARAAGTGDEDVGGPETTWPDGSTSAVDGGRPTRTGVKVGTLGYMAPEQWAGAQPDARSDQYSFCAVLHEAVYGVRPHRGETIEALDGAMPEPPTLPDQPGVPAWLHAAIKRGLSRAPEDRFASLEQLLELLARDPEGQWRQRRRRVLQVFVVLAAAVLLAVGIVQGTAALERRAKERQAEVRRAALAAEVEALRGRGGTAEAASLLHTFVEMPEHRETAAIARAYLDWAGGEPDHAAAVDAYASAYITARTREDELTALTGLVHRLAARGAIAESAAALAVLERDAVAADPSLADARLDAALHRRDLRAARAVLADGADPGRWGPVLGDLSHVTAIPRTQFGGVAGAGIYARAADVDGDGRMEVAAAVLSWPEAVVRVLRADPVFTPLYTLRTGLVTAISPLPFAATGEPMVLVDGPSDAPQTINGGQVESGELRLLRIAGDGAATPVLRWQDSKLFDAVAADVDGDGRTELYVGTGAYNRHLLRLDRADDGTWSRRSAHPPTDALLSDVNAVAAADLDGDGRDELIAAVGPWDAYDLRILRAGADGQLELAARRAFGNIPALAVLRTEVGPVVAFLKNDDFPGEGRFPPDRPLGEPAGLYFVGLRGAELKVLGFVPDRPAAGPALDFRTLLAGDLDGDGRDELVAGGRPDTLVLLRWRADEPTRPLVVPGLVPALVLDVDDDGRAEILAVPQAEPEVLLLLGAGESSLAPVDAAVPAPRRPPVGLADPALAAAWARGEQLVAIGLLRRPADELAALASLSGQVAEDMYFRTGELYARIGDHTRAAEQFMAAARRPSLASAALAGAVASRRQLGEFAAAEALTRTRLALPGLAEEERAAARRELAALEQTNASRPVLALDFTRPLLAGWQIFDPLAVQRDPVRRELSLWTSPLAVAAALPLVWDGGVAVIEAELAVDRVEWGAELTVAVAGVGGPPRLGVQVDSEGEFKAPDIRAMVIGDRPRQEPEAPLKLRTPAVVRVRVALHPDVDAVISEVEVDGVLVRREVRSNVQALETSGLTPGPVQLQLGSGLLHPGLVGHVWVRRIRLEGFVAASEPDARATPGWLLADGDLLAALAALPDPAVGSEGQLWRAEALARLGRVDEATAALRGFAALADEAPPYTALYHRLRRGRDALTLAARASLGERFIDVVTQPLLAWQRGVDLVEALEGLEIPTEQTDPIRRARQSDGLYIRGRALAHVGRFAAAAEVYAAGLALLADAEHPIPDATRRRELMLGACMEMAAETGDVAATMRWMREMLAVSTIPEVQLEHLQADPRYALLGPEDWAALAP